MKKEPLKIHDVKLTSEEIEGILLHLENSSNISKVECLITAPSSDEELVEYGCPLHSAGSFCETDHCNETCDQPKKFDELKTKLEALIKDEEDAPEKEFDDENEDGDDES